MSEGTTLPTVPQLNSLEVYLTANLCPYDKLDINMMLERSENYSKNRSIKVVVIAR